MRSTRRPQSTTPPRTQKGIALHRGPSMYWIPDSTPPRPPRPLPVIANHDSSESALPADLHPEPQLTHPTPDTNTPNVTLDAQIQDPAPEAMPTGADAQALEPKPEAPIPDPGTELPPADPDAGIPQDADAELPAGTAGPAVAVSLATPNRPIGFLHHQRQCSICDHSLREDIEQDFLDWWSAKSIVDGYALGHVSALYRHAHATGLFARRRALRIFALERIIERVCDVDVTAFSIVMAMRILNDMLEKPTSRGSRRPISPPRPAAPTGLKRGRNNFQPDFRVNP
jgi:hypothetical protein